jgi:hypothetical protein
MLMPHPRSDYEKTISVEQTRAEYNEYKNLVTAEMARWRQRAIERGTEIRRLEKEISELAFEQWEAGW